MLRCKSLRAGKTLWYGPAMVLQNEQDPEWGARPDISQDRLYNDLRENFDRAAGGGDCMRTASLINLNLQDMGVCEWMEAYSCDGQRWQLKRMEWKPGADGRTEIHQHLQRQYHDINFGEALYYLDHYEQAQLALGYLPDEQDRGQCTGTPLYRDVAAEEGIVCDINGRLVIPYKGHLLGSGVFPVEAFQIAAQRAAPAGSALVPAEPQQSLIPNAGRTCTLSEQMRDNLISVVGEFNLKIYGLRNNGDKLLENTKKVFGYKSFYHEHHFNSFSNTYYLQKKDAMGKVPKNLAGFLYTLTYMAELILLRVIAAKLMSKIADSANPARSEKIFAEAINLCNEKIKWFGSTIDQDEYSVSRTALEHLDPETEFRKVKDIVMLFDEMARSDSLDLEALYLQAPAENKKAAAVTAPNP